MRTHFGSLGAMISSSPKIHTSLWGGRTHGPMMKGTVRPNVGYFANHKTYHANFHSATHMDPI